MTDGQVSRVLVVTDLWPTARHPGLAPWIVEPVQGMLDRGVDARVIVLRREFPPSRLVSSLGAPNTAGAAWREWNEERRSSLLHPGMSTPLLYTSPPRPWAHDTWGAWAWSMRRAALLRLAKDAAPELVVGHFATPAGDVAVRLARRLGVPAAVHVHGADLAYTARRSARGHERVASILSSADLVVANSGITSAAISHMATPQRLVTLWQGGDVTVSAESIATGDRLRVLTVGGLGSGKGWNDTVAILRALRTRGVDFKWTVAGAGTPDEVTSLLRAAAFAGVSEYVDYRGEVPHEDIVSLMASSDVFLLPSQIDAYGVVYAEALGAGLLVVGGAAAGAILDFGRAGAPVIAMSPGSAEEVAETLRAFAADSARLLSVRVAGVRWAETHLGWARYLDRLTEDYAKVIKVACG